MNPYFHLLPTPFVVASLDFLLQDASLAAPSVSEVEQSLLHHLDDQAIIMAGSTRLVAGLVGMLSSQQAPSPSQPANRPYPCCSSERELLVWGRLPVSVAVATCRPSLQRQGLPASSVFVIIACDEWGWVKALV
jgi:hypothetical protein